jgi:hypothetical protein
MENTAQEQNILAFVSLGTGILAVLLAIIGFCCCSGCLQVPFSIAAFATGGIAIHKVNSSDGEMGGAAFAYAGIGTGVLAWLINIGWVVFGLVVQGGLAMMQ